MPLEAASRKMPATLGCLEKKWKKYELSVRLYKNLIIKIDSRIQRVEQTDAAGVLLLEGRGVVRLQHQVAHLGAAADVKANACGGDEKG